jgi:hypothetical protein
LKFATQWHHSLLHKSSNANIPRPAYIFYTFDLLAQWCKFPSIKSGNCARQFMYH